MASQSIVEQVRRPQIIDAALSVIAERGFQNVTLDDVAKAAGLSKGGLVHYYPTKYELMKAACLTFFDRIFERGRVTRDLYDDPLEQVLSYTWLYDPDDHDLITGYRLQFDYIALASQDQEFRAMFAEWVDTWVDLLSKSIAKGVAQGVFHVADVAGAARAVSAIYHGVCIRWYLGRETHSPQWAVDTVRRAVTLLLTNCDQANQDTQREEG